MNKKRLLINLISSIFAFGVQLGINFLLTPFLVKNLGNESYGFIGLANNFVSYATILTVALNSMASRFISIEIHRKNIKEANTYFSSVAIANVIISIVVLIVSGLMIFNLNKFINIPPAIDFDVKLTFTLVFLNFVLTLLSTVYTVATFVKNRVDISSIVKSIGLIIQILILLTLFTLLKPKIYYIGIVAILNTSFLLLTNGFITRKLLPDMKVKIENFKVKAIKAIISSGIWNSINSLSTALLTGLDLLIANVFINAEAMGTLSIAKTIPIAFITLLGSIGGVFTPQFTILYSKNNTDGLVTATKLSIKILSLIMIVPIAGFVVFGQEFFSLWMPYKNQTEVTQIHILSILALGPNLFSSYIYSLYSINIVTNKVRTSCIVTLGLSILSTIIVYVMLKTTNLGVYAVAGVSSIILILRILIFVPTYAAHNLKIKLTTFYPPLIKSILCSIFVIILYYVVKSFIEITSWTELIAVAVIVGSIGYIATFVLILNKKEKLKLKKIILKKFKKVEVTE